ncbi:MAG: hypothetical protein COT24_00525 [Candidatus Kerfeldbacteria bacterium CG08_land_8_20_14_0_20_40_16]|uniref:Uncharacterized protein n=1 Tax=Candidatus Kerfeldbacteria bacterium CG08_land_8_20_14_0_20_40_16 TaxID=2014244 RepID=A0A2H0YX01_9BACT|nr:MAG: hypothetical protein COT24_00525 [Candidatus Kerfeldbacteria bacterium CG08_land_8_20_14_0_20_40_16]
MNLQPTTPPTTSQNPTQQKKPKNRKPGYIVNVVLNILFLYVANHLIVWEAQFIKGEWAQVLGIINVSIIMNLIAYALFVLYDGRLFYLVSRSALDVVSFIVGYRLYKVFPFDFNGFFEMGWLNEVVPYLLILGMVGIIISLIVRVARFAGNKNIYY